MGDYWISFPGLLRCWAFGLVLALVLDQVRGFQLLRPHKMLPLALVPALLWMQPSLIHLAVQCQASLLNSPPGMFFQHTFNLPLS